MEIIKHVFQDFVTVDHRIWFTSSIMNGLFTSDMEGGQTKLVRIFPEEELFQNRLYTEMYAYNNRLIFIPYSAESISIYNILDDRFTQIAPPISKKERKRSSFVTVQWENKIFLFNDHMQGMAVLDVKDCTIRMCPIPMRENFFGFNEMPIRCVIDDCAYMALSNLMIMVRMSSDQVFVHEIADEGVQFACIRYCRDAFWIVDRENQLYTYQDGDRRAERKMKLLQADWKEPLAMVKNIFCNDENVWVLLNKQNYMIRLNISTMEKKIVLYETTDEGRNYSVEYSYYDSQKQQAHMLFQGEDRHRVLDLNTGDWSKIIYWTSWEEIRTLYQKYMRQRGNFMTETVMGKGLDIIRLFLDIQNEADDLDIKKSCGREIFWYMV